MADEIRFLGDLHRIDLKAGDRFVLTTECRLSVEACERIRDVWQKFVGDTDAYPLLILDQGTKLGVVGQVSESIASSGEN